MVLVLMVLYRVKVLLLERLKVELLLGWGMMNLVL